MLLKQPINILILITIIGAIVVGCNGDNQEVEEDNPYTYLEGVSVNIERIIQGVEQIYNRREKLWDSIGLEDKIDFVEEGSNDGGEEEEQSQEILAEKEGQLLEIEDEIWDRVEESLEDLHYSWNKYESHQKIDKEKVDSIEGELNSSSDLLVDKEPIPIMASLNRLNLEVVDLYQKHGEGVRGDLKKVVFYAREIFYKSILEEEKEGEFEELKEVLSQLEGEFEGKEGVKFKELRNAVYDLQSAVEEESKEAIKIKVQLIIDLVEVIRPTLKS